MILIYDGDCGFCTKCTEFAKKRLAQPVEIIPYQMVDDLAQYKLTAEDTQHRVYCVSDNGVVSGGSRAIFLIGKKLHQPWALISSVLLLPGVSFIAEPIYKLIARNRHRMPGGTAACAIDKPHKSQEQ